MRKTLLALAALTLIGCGGDSTGVGGGNVAGTWNLETVNSSPLPYTAIFIASPVYKFEILSDQFVANSNGTFTEALTTRETEGTTVTTSTENDTGTWSQSGSAMTITSSDGSVSLAQISGNTITAAIQGFTFVFRKQ